jgi:hypothetical protein
VIQLLTMERFGELRGINGEVWRYLATVDYKEVGWDQRVLNDL